ncbi:MAG: hypothetical protein NZ951_00420 [Dehalococcoidia bacterium]|nr:hypothetical protein [Dehalococcoidia bacterium]MDW8119110.1 hypothetical protein [Chloroflexota bacterium]
MNLKELVSAHRAHSPRLSGKPLEAVLLWYADLGLEVWDEEVRYHCPSCGIVLTVPVEEFVVRDSNEDLRCDACRGELEERGGPMA